MTDHGLIEKLGSIHISRCGFAAGAAATLAARQGRQARAQVSTPVVPEGETFDAGGATLRVASWGGFWQEIERTYLLEQFQEDFNCTVQYTSTMAKSSPRRTALSPSTSSTGRSASPSMRKS